MIPEWFKVGVKTSFLGLSEETEVLSIDLNEGSWIGFDADGKHKYPLDEVNRYWKLANADS